MLFYHGTTRSVAEAIQREGLRPHRETAFKITTYDGQDLRALPGEQAQTIYITPSLDWASSYARFRAKYEMAEKGDGLIFGHSDEPYFYKQTPSCNCKEEPVVLVFDVPEEIAHKFETDIQSMDAGFVCECSLEPKYIKGIIPPQELGVLTYYYETY